MKLETRGWAFFFLGCQNTRKAAFQRIMPEIACSLPSEAVALVDGWVIFFYFLFFILGGGGGAKRAGTRFNTRAVSTIAETPLMIFVEAERRFSIIVGASSFFLGCQNTRKAAFQRIMPEIVCSLPSEAVALVGGWVIFFFLEGGRGGGGAKRAGTRFNTRAVSTIAETPLMIFVEAERRFSINVGASSQQPRLFFYQEASCTQFGLGGVRGVVRLGTPLARVKP